MNRSYPSCWGHKVSASTQEEHGKGGEVGEQVVSEVLESQG